MNKIVEGLKVVEVIADDLLICGFGATKEEATANHDENLCFVLETAREQGLSYTQTK